jgi:predicted TIM-barrel fold metal-dependent hydrolase
MTLDGAFSTTRQTGSAPMLIDTDVHNAVPPDAIRALSPHLPTRWAQYLETVGARSLGEDVLVRMRPATARADSWPPNGKGPGEDPDFAREQLLDTWGIDYAILNNTSGTWQPYIGGNQPAGLTVALMHALNEWNAEHWLAHDQRWLSAVCVPFEHPREAAREIALRREGGQAERWVQVLLADRLERPIGHEKYRPLLEAAAHYGLPIAFHPGGRGMNPITASGCPSTYYEDHVGYPQAAFSHLASLIFEGVFDRLPALKVVVVEGGYSWAAPYAWRIDRCWTILRDEVPDLRRRPSEYLRDHVWFTTQPVEEPERPRWFAAMYEQLRSAGLAERLMFSSDYPHWDFDAPTEAIPRSLGEADRAAILYRTASLLYRIPVHEVHP